MQNYKGIPAELFIWITYLAEAIPARSIPTFIELLIGAMLVQKGFVTEVYLAVEMKRQWFSYYKWLETGKWSWIALGMQMARLATSCLGLTHIFLIIDDFTIIRASKQAPDIGIQPQQQTQSTQICQRTSRCYAVNGGYIRLEKLRIATASAFRPQTRQ